jgi:hypothetical protein
MLNESTKKTPGITSLKTANIYALTTKKRPGYRFVLLMTYFVRRWCSEEMTALWGGFTVKWFFTGSANLNTSDAYDCALWAAYVSALEP